MFFNVFFLSQESGNTAEHRFYQYICMDKMYRNRADGYHKYNNRIDFCNVPGFVCHKHLIYAFEWELETNYSVRNIDWIPPTVRRASFHQCNFPAECQLSTPLLPRDLRFLQICACRLTGTVNLTVLPNKMEEIHLRINDISGSVDLRSLPAQMCIVDLAYNELDSVIWSAVDLPDTINEIHVHQKYKRIENKQLDAANGSHACMHFSHTAPPPVGSKYYMDDLEDRK